MNLNFWSVQRVQLKKVGVKQVKEALDVCEHD